MDHKMSEPSVTLFDICYFMAPASSIWRRQWQPTPVLLPGKFHGRRSLVGYNPWGREESDTTQQLHFYFHSLEKEMATRSSVLAWRIPVTAEPGGLLSMGPHRVRHDWSDLAAAASSIALEVLEVATYLDHSKDRFSLSSNSLMLKNKCSLKFLKNLPSSIWYI